MLRGLHDPGDGPRRTWVDQVNLVDLDTSSVAWYFWWCWCYSVLLVVLVLLGVAGGIGER
ncbi:hypothetical protein [Streptomyces sp. NPDC056542]|uniref:hypothetical protein n=1 Tax=Streptomyces sp. NPDC056542 TaxID=3345861 RepID=UPI0036856994